MSTATASSIAPWRSGVRSALAAAYPSLIERMPWSREQIVAHQRTRLAELLRTAVARSPFHARRLEGIDPAAVDPTDLRALPVMTKAQMMDELDDVFTDRALTGAEVEAALAATRDQPVPIRDRYIAYTSGGSSGVRGVYVLDQRAAVGFVGSLTRGLVARLRTGGTPPGGLVIGLVAARSPVHPTGSAQPLTEGGALGFRYVCVPVTDPLQQIVDRLNALRPHIVYGYPTMLARVAREGLDFTPGSVVSSSETLTPELRATIREGLGAPVADNFASTEGLVGMSAPDDDVITLAEDTCIVEVEEDRVLVTNLENHVQPLIRYELRDRFTVVPGGEALRVRVEGRADDILRFDDVPVHLLVIRSELVATPEVLDYQVRQTRGGVDVDVLAPDGADADDLRARIEAALEAAGVDGPVVAVREVADLGRHPETGKLARFVPLR